MEYFNYRIRLKASRGNECKNNGYTERLKLGAEEEISTLDKYSIKPVKTIDLFKGLRPAGIPEFLHVYNPGNMVELSLLRRKKILFITSSRYNGSGIFVPSLDLIEKLQDLIALNQFDLSLSGINSQAEINFIKIAEKDGPPVMLLPHNPFFSDNKLIMNNYLKGGLPWISAVDPFSKPGKHGFSLRNLLAFSLSSGLAILFLSAKSSLKGITDKFEAAGKEVKVLLSDRDFFKERPEDTKRTQNLPSSGSSAHTINQHEIRKLILEIVPANENIPIDNLIKVGNINHKVDRCDILKAISIMEINSEIIRLPGGLIKKIDEKSSNS